MSRRAHNNILHSLVDLDGSLPRAPLLVVGQVPGHVQPTHLHLGPAQRDPLRVGHHLPQAIVLLLRVALQVDQAGLPEGGWETMNWLRPCRDGCGLGPAASSPSRQTSLFLPPPSPPPQKNPKFTTWCVLSGPEPRPGPKKKSPKQWLRAKLKRKTHSPRRHSSRVALHLTGDMLLADER